MAGLELKVPPPVVGLACAAMMKGLAMLAAPSLPPSPLDGGPWTPLRLGAIALALVGFFAAILARPLLAPEASGESLGQAQPSSDTE